MMKEHGLLILLMSIVTIAPRLVPLAFAKYKIPHFVQEWMKCVPYSALAALIFPSVLYIDSTNMHIGILGLASSVCLSLIRIPVYLVVVGSITIVYMYYLVF